MSKKTGLILEGGGLRGAYSAGCLSWLLDNNIEFDNAYGISTGAIHLCSYLMKSKKNLLSISTKYIVDKGNIGLRAFLRCGRIVDYDYMFNKLLLEKTDFDLRRVKDNKCNGYVGLYELEKGKTEYKNIRDIDLRELQASTTLPVIGKVMEMTKDRHILDGGITKMIPVEKAMEDGCDKMLIIATKPIDYVRKPAKKIVVDVMKTIYPKWPSVAEDYNIRHLNYVKQISIIKDTINQNKAIYLCPSQKNNVSRLGGSEKDLRELYELGYKDIEASKDKIFELLK